MAVIPLGEPTVRRPGPPHFALWALGFRPFYLLAAAFAALGVPLWVMVWSGGLALPLPGMEWHAHEMLFGFVAAVVVGFLYTAGRNWTGLPTPSGMALAGLAALWLAGRLAMALSASPWAAAIDLAFLPVAAVPLARVLWKAGSRRNYFVILILGLLATANLGFHLLRHGVLAGDPLTALHTALGLVVVLETVIGGRVIPSFTASALRGVKQWQHAWLDRAAIGVGAVALGLFALAPHGSAAPLMALAAAVLHLARWAGWNPWATRQVPLLWSLHAAYAWIPLGLALIAATEWELLPRSAGIHALAIGATGGLIIGMITRTALGHTGRPLQAGRSETLAYLGVQFAAVARVLTLAAIPVASTAGVHLAATCWSLAFLLYLWRYLPWLMRSRIDGQPG